MHSVQYVSGEPVRQGDRVLYLGEPGRVEFVVRSLTGEPGLDWYVQQFGGGAMIHTKDLGSVFLGPDDLDDRLALVSRDEGTT